MTTIETIIGAIIRKDQWTTIGMIIQEISTGLMIGKTITDKVIEGTTETGKIMEETTPNKGIEIEVRVGRVQKLQ